ncbi:hypothetical protein MKZ38_005266 [Zalerion maritima]|uniref:C2H2-type domain-containing protein n=1 Tax=Zalerion maritima TaxID=339359 RepID=A0AAD5RK89_9PEZI|nr:hypothetical protein MKZ38_005266 [Zalerion maritima]
MGRAEVGSTKHLSNKMKSKGLQRLRWYCQVCEKQCRDENGFKMHTQSESHVRQMLVVGDDPKKFINQFSDEFLRNFVQTLKTAHGTKQVHMNHFYSGEIVSMKEHVHLNSTKWSSLTEFAKYLGREGICRVEDVEGKGLHVAWVDTSPEALKRQEMLRRKEMMDKGDEEREQMIIREQIKRAQREKEAKGGKEEEDMDEEEKEMMRELKREEGQKVKLTFGKKGQSESKSRDDNKAEDAKAESITPDPTAAYGTKEGSNTPDVPSAYGEAKPNDTSQPASTTAATAPKPLAIKMGATKPQPKNVFKQAKKAFGGGKKSTEGDKEPKKKMSETERIMREEMERKRTRDVAPGLGFSFPSNKKQKRF